VPYGTERGCARKVNASLTEPPIGTYLPSGLPFEPWLELGANRATCLCKGLFAAPLVAASVGLPRPLQCRQCFCNRGSLAKALLCTRD
jgi:hypothetical protein